MANDDEIIWDDEAPAGGSPAQKSGGEEIEWDTGEPVGAHTPTWGEWARQKVGAGLIGARETLPFAKDIAAATKATVGVPGVSAPTGDFEEAKKGVERQQEAASKESPLAYGAGEVGAFFVPLAGAEGSLANLTSKAESALASKLAPKIGKTAAEIGSTALTGAGMGAIQGAGEGTGIQDRLISAGETGLLGGGLGAAFPAAGKVAGKALSPFIKPTAVEEAATRIGHDMPASISSPSSITRRVSSALSSTPFTKDIMEGGVKRGVAELGERVTGLAKKPGITTEEAAATAKQALHDWVDVDSRANVNKLYNKVAALVDPKITTPMSNTLAAVSKIGKERVAAKLGDSEAVKLVMDAATDPKGLTYSGAQRLKREIGSKMKGIMTESSLNEEELKQLYGGLRADVRAAAKNAGGPKGLAAFDRANGYAQGVINRRKDLGKIIGAKGDKNDEAIFKKIASIAGTTGSNASLLKTARKSMSPDEWQDVTSGVITTLGRDADKAFSTDRFVTQFGKLSPAGKDAIFGPAGNPLRNAIEDMHTVAQQYKERGKERNFSNTAIALLGAAGLGDIAIEGTAGLEHEAALAAGTIPLALLLSRPRAAQAIAAALKNRNPATLANLKNVVQMEMREHFGAQPRIAAEDREERASGGAVSKRDYPAKRLTKLERAAKKAQDAIALETKPIMNQPDALVAKALEIAKER